MKVGVLKRRRKEKTGIVQLEEKYNSAHVTNDPAVCRSHQHLFEVPPTPYSKLIGNAKAVGGTYTLLGTTQRSASLGDPIYIMALARRGLSRVHCRLLDRFVDVDHFQGLFRGFGDREDEMTGVLSLVTFSAYEYCWIL